MKKGYFILLGMVLIACSSTDNSGSHAPGQTSSVEDVLEQGMAEADGRTGTAAADAPAPEIRVDETTVLSEDTAVDVDLTTISSSMVYSVVYDMVYNPDPYLGKTVKMQGLFTTIYDEENNKRYYACVIQDATACCSQGIEFVLKDERVYPEEYPEIGEEITVIGTFDSYDEGMYRFCTLNDAVLQ